MAIKMSVARQNEILDAAFPTPAMLAIRDGRPDDAPVLERKSMLDQVLVGYDKEKARKAEREAAEHVRNHLPTTDTLQTLRERGPFVEAGQVWKDTGGKDLLPRTVAYVKNGHAYTLGGTLSPYAIFGVGVDGRVPVNSFWKYLGEDEGNEWRTAAAIERDGIETRTRLVWKGQRWSYLGGPPRTVASFGKDDGGRYAEFADGGKMRIDTHGRSYAAPNRFDYVDGGPPIGQKFTIGGSKKERVWDGFDLVDVVNPVGETVALASDLEKLKDGLIMSMQGPVIYAKDKVGQFYRYVGPRLEGHVGAPPAIGSLWKLYELEEDRAWLELWEETPSGARPATGMSATHFVTKLCGGSMPSCWSVPVAVAVADGTWKLFDEATRATDAGFAKLVLGKDVGTYAPKVLVGQIWKHTDKSNGSMTYWRVEEVGSDSVEIADVEDRLHSCWPLIDGALFAGQNAAWELTSPVLDTCDEPERLVTPRCGQTWRNAEGIEVVFFDHEVCENVDVFEARRIDGLRVNIGYLKNIMYVNGVAGGWTFVSGPTTPETPQEAMERVIRLEAARPPDGLNKDEWLCAIVNNWFTRETRPVTFDDVNMCRKMVMLLRRDEVDRWKAWAADRPDPRGL